MPFTAPKLSRLIVAAIGLVMTFALASSAHAGSMVLPQLYPKAFISGVTATYSLETINSTKLGHFNATGNLDNYMPDSATITPAAGTFSINLYFTSAGTLLGSQSGTELYVKNASSQNLFYSTQAYSTNPFCTTTSLKMETLWAKPAGAASGLLASTSSYPFIGSYIVLNSNVSYSTGVSGFAFSTSTTYANNVLFSTTNSMGAANVFMTPTPAAVGGGVVLFGAIAMRRKGRRVEV